MLAQTAAQTQSDQVAAAVGQWTQPVDMGVVGISAALLHTGKVLFFYYPKEKATRSPAALYDPASGKFTDATPPFDRNIFCSGISMMADGRVLVTGGMATSWPGPDAGIKGTSIFDPATNAWSQTQDMKLARWYPSNVLLPDATTITLSGLDENADKLQRVMESYNPQNGQWTTLPTSANAPNGTDLYPRMVVLSDGTIFMAGYGPDTHTFNPATNTWKLIGNLNFGSRVEGGVVMLPDGQRVLTAGGGLTFQGEATATAEIIDFSRASPAWSYVAPMHFARKHLNLVMLADGNVLAVGGGTTGKYAGPVRQAELYNAAANTWTVMASQKANRTYHSTAILLPDGRVISAGSDFGNQGTTFEIFSPPYLFRGKRPVISSAPKAVQYGAQFNVTTADASEIGRVGLIRPGATTHANNFDQRYVKLRYEVQSGQLKVTAPGSSKVAPPGYYMLVIINKNNVPSVMPFVKLQ
jgi:hypothetical protein